MYNNKAAELITVITTTHPICTVPSDEHLYLAQASLFINPTLAKSKKIIVFDGVAPGFKNRSSNYVLYKKKIQFLQETDPIFANTELVFCEEWVQLSGTIRLALKYVTTPFVFIHQHDMCFTKKFNLDACLSSMLANKNIKWIHFSGKFNSSLKGDIQSSCFGPLDNYVEGKSLIPLTRAYGWSDHAHIAHVDYYNFFIMPMCKNNYMEDHVHKNFKKALLNKTSSEINAIHLKFGTYLYGDLEDGCFFYHIDGRANDPKYYVKELK
ncbi:MAG: hypothetical protein ACH349_00170 [Candidatus Rhabdochlamydia sp.]|nr:hypothetical protein [Chlamydiota bacterium]